MDVQYKDIIEFWFADEVADAPTLDGRMTRWFGNGPELDGEISERFGERVEEALRGELNDWADSAEGCLALILVLDIFPRRIFKNQPDALRGDKKALKACINGTNNKLHRELSAEQRIFFFMPLQRAESPKIQEKSVKVYQSLGKNTSDTMQETFETIAMFAELRHDIIAEFGRFPHRNAMLGRTNTGEEDQHLQPGDTSAAI